MGRLADDITRFLEYNGFECSLQMRYDFDVICVKTLDGKMSRIIMPLEIKDHTLEDAIKSSENAWEAVRMMSGHEGYPLIITEDRWMRQGDMMKARLLAHLELFSQAYARNCEVRRIGKAEAQAFLKENHSYGYAACRYRYGLFLRRHTGHIAEELRSLDSARDDSQEKRNDSPEKWDDSLEKWDDSREDRDDSREDRKTSNGHIGNLIAVATFSNARRWIKDGKEISSYEWTRYASLPGMRVSGGMGKLLKAFINDVHPDDIMSYADLEWSEGSVYKALGFRAELGKEPVDFVVDGQTWERSAMRSLDKLGMTEGGSRMTEGRSGMTEGRSRMTGELFFRNFGSRKFRLKLTDYR
ncbi:MAG: hypothetical protein IJ971_10145 [Bacteroidales bacterium]|nr:hypothetical protein [Bacteroidales bacterium]